MRLSGMTLVRALPLVLIGGGLWYVLKPGPPEPAQQGRGVEVALAPVSSLETSAGVPPVDLEEALPFLRRAQLADAAGRPDLMAASVAKLRALDPKGVYFLFYQTYLQLMENRVSEAQATLDRLTSRYPESARAAAMQRYFEALTSRRGDLQQARLLATAGRYPEALAVFSELFPDGMPTLRMQLDYLAIAGQIKARWQSTREALETLNRRYPQMPPVQLALANHIASRFPADPQVLSLYRRMAHGPDLGRQAADAWLRALSRRPVNADTLEEYAELARRYPSDPDIQDRLKQAKKAIAEERQRMRDPYYRAMREGLVLLERDQNDRAEQRLRYALIGRPADEEVLGGIGMVLLRRGQQAQALPYFQKALANNSNPDLRSKWQGLIATSRYWAWVKEADSLIAKGQSIEAEKRLGQATQLRPELPRAYVSLGDLALAQRRYADADAFYLQALERAPLDGAALWARVVLREQRYGRQQALDFADQLTPAQQRQIASRIQRMRADNNAALLARAMARGDAGQLRDILARALNPEPSSPWLRADIADAYVSLGEPERADTLMAQWTRRDANPEMRFAYALYLARRGRPQAAQEQLENVPPAQRSVAMESNLLRWRIASDLAGLEGQADGEAPPKAQLIQRLDQLADQYGDDTDAMLRLAELYIDAGDSAAAEKIVDALSPGEDWPVSRRLAYGDVLINLQQYPRYAVLTSTIGRASLSEDEQRQFARQRARYQLAQAEDFENRQKYVVAYSLYHQAAQVEGSHQIRARLGAMRNSRRIGEEQSYREQATALLAQSGSLWPSALVDLAQAFQDSGDAGGRDMALNHLKARGDASSLDMRNAMLLAESAEHWQTAEEFAYLALAREAVEPTSLDAAAGQRGPHGFDLAAGGATAGDAGQTRRQHYQQAQDNWLTRSVKARIDTYRDRRDGHIIVGFDHSVRDGREKTAQVPIEARIPVPDLDGHLLLRADYVSLNSGRIDYLDPTPGGSGTVSRIPFAERASGYALGIGWQADTWQADLGTTPMGLRESSWVGGFSTTGDVGEVGWRLTLSRRPELGTTLAYGGMEVPQGAATGAGTEWGGVLRSGVKLGLSYDKGGPLGYWSSLQFHLLKGTRVEDNQRLAALAGVYWRVLAEEDRNIRLGLNFTHLQYDKNLEEFTLGHGGYYSPQNYFSLSIPLRFYGRWGPKWSYLLGASVSQSVKREDPPFNLGGQASNGGGFGYALEAALERRLTDRWYVGLAADIQRADFYEPNHVVLYLRYTFEDRWRALPSPPEPPIPYNTFD